MTASKSFLEKLRISLREDANRRFVVAYSGGIDSHVLLHAMVNYIGKDKQRLHVAHVNHGLQPDSKQWAERCVLTSTELGIAATVLKIDEAPPPGQSIESWARGHRYRLLKNILCAEDVLLTAHHQDDLAETLLLQLFRGAGPHGLASIADRQQFGLGILLRPLLNVTSADICEYARVHDLEWIDDPSNEQDRYDRNYIRHRVLPVIEQRWPAVSERIAHAVKLQVRAAAGLDEAADAILKDAIGSEGSQISVVALRQLSDEMQSWVLRRWIARASFPIPDAAHVREMHRMIRARVDAEPCLSWKGSEMRRYRDTLFLMQARPRRDVGSEYRWDFIEPLALVPGLLSATVALGCGLDANDAAQQRVVVRFRRGGERCHPITRTHSQSLKKLFQEWGIPPWLRGEIPLIFVGEEIAAVAGICVCRPFVAGEGEKGWTLQWDPDSTRAVTGD